MFDNDNMILNKCFQCDCYDEDFGCTMSSYDKVYACPLNIDSNDVCKNCYDFVCLFYISNDCKFDCSTCSCNYNHNFCIHESKCSLQNKKQQNTQK